MLDHRGHHGLREEAAGRGSVAREKQKVTLKNMVLTTKFNIFGIYLFCTHCEKKSKKPNKSKTKWKSYIAVQLQIIDSHMQVPNLSCHDYKTVPIKIL